MPFRPFLMAKLRVGKLKLRNVRTHFKVMLWSCSLSLMYLVIVKVVGAISKCVLVVESLNELKVQVTLVSVHFICNKIYSIKKLHIEGLKSMIGKDPL